MTAKKKTTPRTPKFTSNDPQKKRSQEILLGGFLILVALLLFLSFVSYFFNWKADQSTLDQLSKRSLESKNLSKKLGPYFSHLFLFQLFGLAAFIFDYLLLITGLFLF